MSWILSYKKAKGSFNSFCTQPCTINRVIKPFGNDDIENDDEVPFCGLHGHCPGAGSGQLAAKELFPTPVFVLCLFLIIPFSGRLSKNYFSVRGGCSSGILKGKWW